MIEIITDDGYTLIGRETAQAIKDLLFSKLPKVINVVKGRYPEYLKSLYILSSTIYHTDDKTAKYKIATVHKSIVTNTNLKYLVLDEHNNYRGFADNEYQAIELAELIIKKPLYT